MTDCLYPKNEDFFNTYGRLAPVSLFIIRAKECELFSRYVYERPILDIGSGEGIFASTLFEGQIDVGVDIDLKNVYKARKLRAYKEVYCREAEDLPFSSSYFRTVISNCVLEHVQDLDRTLSEIRRVLTPGGRAYLSVVTSLFSEAMSLSDIMLNKLGIKLKLSSKLLDYLFCHNYVLSADEWKMRITKAGLTIKEVYPYLSPQLLHIMGFFLVSSLSSFIYKRTINRWKLFPKFNRPKVFMNFIRRYYDKESEEGGCLFFVVSKE